MLKLDNDLVDKRMNGYLKALLNAKPGTLVKVKSYSQHHRDRDEVVRRILEVTKLMGLDVECVGRKSKYVVIKEDRPGKWGIHPVNHNSQKVTITGRRPPQVLVDELGHHIVR